MAELAIHVEKLNEEVVVIEARGTIDAETYEQMEDTAEEVFSEGYYKVICNLEGVEYISSAGAGVFLGMVDQVEENQGNIILLRPSREVQDVFDPLGLLEIIPYVDTIEEALEKFDE